MEAGDLITKFPIALYQARARIEDGKVILKEINFLNSWIENITGWKLEEIKENPSWWFDNIHPDDRERIYFECKELVEGKDLISRIYRFRRKDGTYAYFRDAVSFLDVIDESEIEVVGVIEDVSKEMEYYEVFSVIDTTPQVGVLIYQERIVYANRAAQYIFGYSREELCRLPVHEIVAPEHREMVKEIAKRRLKGEQFERIYTEFPVRTKEGNVRYMFIYTKTVTWNNRPAGFVIFFDITKRVKYERLFRALKRVNELMVSALDERDLLRRVCEVLVNEAGFRMAWVGVPDERSGYVKPIHICGHDEGYVERLRISIDENLPEGQGPTGKALREGKIVINPDTRTNPDVEPWREEMLKRNFLSSCAIPLQVEGKTVAILNLYSQTPNMFTEEELEFLKEIQSDLSHVLERIRRDKFLRMVNVAIEKGHEWVLITDENGRILYVNEAVSKISGYSPEELIGKKPNIFKSGYHDVGFYRRLWNTIKAGVSFQAVFVNRKKNGEIFYLDQNIIPVRVGKGELRFVAIGKDVTAERYLEEELARLKYTDPLTGLPNREGFIASAELALEKEKDKTHVLYVIDIVGLASINQIFGTRAGDVVLKEVAKRLQETLCKRDIAGRIGGDEFAVFVKGVSEREITTVTDKLISSLLKPVRVDGREVPLSVNIGASVYPQDAKTVKSLMEKAYMALSFSKREGEDTYRFFSSEINRMVEENLKARSEIRSAVEEGRFTFFLQPYYRTYPKEIAGFEVLLRMKNREGNILSPKDFILVLERTGLIRDVENRVLLELRDLILSRKDAVFSFNVSPASFRDEGFVELVKEVARDVGSGLVLEITERLLVEDMEYTREFLEEVRSAGVKVAVDDFGTGYSSLAYLESLPVDVLKIDMQFVRRMLKSKRTLAVVEAVIHLSKKLGLETVAEGVESEKQFLILRELGCTYAQGFYLAKPMPKEEALKLL